MEKDNIIRIAKFMGATIYFLSDDVLIFPAFETPYVSSNSTCHFKVLCYDSDWKLLMPVIEKISKIPFDGRDTFYPRTFGMLDEDGNFMFRFNSHCLFTHKELIKAAYAAVCDFLENYKKDA